MRGVAVQRALGIVVAVVFAIGAVLAFQRPAPVSSAAASASSTTGPPGGQTSGGPTSGSAPSATPPSSSPTLSGSVATMGPGLTEPGVHVVVQPDATGGLEVVERLKLAAPVSTLTVKVPRSSAPGTTGAELTVTGFQAEADGQVVSDALASPLPESGDRLDLPAPARDIFMRYRLEGGADRSQPAPVGRVLLVLPPVTTADPALGDLSVVVEVVGGTVRNLVCPELPVTDQLCGRQDGRVWATTPIPLGRSTVVAQIDLPQPGAG